MNPDGAGSKAGADYFWDGVPARFAHQGLLRSQHELSRKFSWTCRRGPGRESRRLD